MSASPGPASDPAPPLPEWTPRTVGVLSTLGEDGPHAIPVSAPVRGGDDLILLGLREDRDSLARLGERPAVAITVLTADDVAFTARGQASVLPEVLAGTGYVAVAVAVTAVDDHRQEAFAVTAGIDREWRDTDEQQALGARVAALRAYAESR